jgi:predicted dehydrogenase
MKEMKSHAKSKTTQTPETGHSRRQFLKRSATAIAVPYVISASVLGRGGSAPPSERINLGIIGVNGMGRSNLENCTRHSDVVVSAVCDVSSERRDEVVEQYKSSAKAYGDYRNLLAQPEIDAVIIATPPHWHARMAVDAVEAGKDIYLQKPMTLFPDETLAVRNAVKKHERISQIGTQIHAGSNYRRVVEWIRSGRLGPVSVVRTFNVMNQGPDGIGTAPREDPPPGLDWDLWCGPGPACPFNSLLFKDSYNHCSFWDYSGGWTPGMAPHIIDLPVWALKLGTPQTTTCSGRRSIVGGDGDAPDTQEVVWDYGDTTMTWMMSTCNSFAFDFGRGEPARRLGIYFHALNGTLFTNYNKHEIVPEGKLLEDGSTPPESIPPSPGHEREWLDCVKSRQEPSCSVDYHWKVDLAITLANLSYRLKRSIHFDPQSEKIVGNPEAMTLARPEYREPWRFPAEYL